VSQKTQEDESITTEDRQKIDILLEELAGLLLILPGAWRSMALKKEHYDYFFHNKLLKSMLEKGVEFEFDFNKFTSAINRELSLRRKIFICGKNFAWG
jgi:hypothetical protein